MGLKHVAFAGVVAAALAVAGQPARAADTIEMGLIGSANSAAWEFYVGQHQGFFASAGLNVDIIYVPTAPGLVQQLAAGSLDAVDIGVVEPIHAVARGAPVAILRVTGAVPLYELDANPAIKTIKDLKGHTVVIGGLLDINRVYLERVLKAADLRDSDIDITVIGNTAGRFAALQSGAADMTMLAPPVNFFAEAAGFNNIGMVMAYAKDLPFGSTDLSLAFAAKHRDAVIHLRDALNKSIAWFNNDANRDGAIDMLANEMKTPKRDDVARAYDYIRKIGYLQNDDTVSRESLETLMNEMAAIGDTDGKVPFDKLILPGITKVGP
jgi:ABC-type nitrate/sulfonate/bicarbonate transport system substrate-binding protein